MDVSSSSQKSQVISDTSKPNDHEKFKMDNITVVLNSKKAIYVQETCTKNPEIEITGIEYNHMGLKAGDGFRLCINRQTS